jgi:Mn2+/Fe2+ NRAMP family transporter
MVMTVQALPIIRAKESAISVKILTSYPIELIGAVTAVIVIIVVHTREKASK